MDLHQVEAMRDRLLHDRRITIGAGIISIVFMLVTFAVGAVLFKRAVDDSRYTTRSIDTPTQVKLLLSENKPGEILNHIVFFHDVKLESGPADNVYYAVGSQGHKVVVVALGTKTAMSDDATVDISGTVRTLPPTTEMKKKWKLDAEQIKAVKEQGVFIEADSIKADKPSQQRLARR